jgi:hypothetical protein
MTDIVRIKDKRIRGAFWTTPEWLTRTRHSILGQAEEQLSNFVVVIPFELQTSPDNAFLEGERFVRDQK